MIALILLPLFMCNRTNKLKLKQIADIWQAHDDVIKWKHFPRYWPFVQGIHRSPVNSPHNGQWRGALMFYLICTGINGSVNNDEACVLRGHPAHYDVTVMHHFEMLFYRFFFFLCMAIMSTFTKKMICHYGSGLQHQVLPQVNEGMIHLMDLSNWFPIKHLSLSTISLQLVCKYWQSEIMKMIDHWSDFEWFCPEWDKYDVFVSYSCHYCLSFDELGSDCRVVKHTQCLPQIYGTMEHQADLTDWFPIHH